MTRKDLNLPRYRLKTGPQSLAFRGSTCGYKLPKDMRKVADCRIFNKRLINMFLKLLSSFFFPSLDIISWACFRPLSRRLDPGDHLVMFSARLKPQRRKKSLFRQERDHLLIYREKATRTKLELLIWKLCKEFVEKRSDTWNSTMTNYPYPNWNSVLFWKFLLFLCLKTKILRGADVTAICNVSVLSIFVWE